MRSAPVLVGILSACLGCGTGESQPAFEPTEWQGSVDSTLPKATQAKQDALIRLFAAIQDVGIERIQWDCPDIDFDESFADFFGETVDLYRWNWAGPPQGDHFPVRLSLRHDDAELTEETHDRTYTVTRRGRSFVIRRANN